jgi:flagellar motor switch protein FliN/FliY
MNDEREMDVQMKQSAALSHDLEPAGAVTMQAIGLAELHEAPSPAAAVPLFEQVHPLHQVKARLQVCVGETTVSIGELLALKEQHTLVLDRAVEQPVDLVLEGKVIARGQLVAVDQHFAVRLTELPLPLKL